MFSTGALNENGVCDNWRSLSKARSAIFESLLLVSWVDFVVAGLLFSLKTISIKSLVGLESATTLPNLAANSSNVIFSKEILNGWIFKQRRD